MLLHFQPQSQPNLHSGACKMGNQDAAMWLSSPEPVSGDPFPAGYGALSSLLHHSGPFTWQKDVGTEVRL